MVSDEEVVCAFRTRGGRVFVLLGQVGSTARKGS